MSVQQKTVSLLFKNFDNVCLASILMAVYIYFSRLNLAFLLIPITLISTRLFVNYQNEKLNDSADSSEELKITESKQKLFILLTKKIYINKDYVALFIGFLMIFAIYYFSLDLTLIYLPVCVFLVRLFEHPASRYFNNALYGAVGAVLLFSIPVYLSIVLPDEAGDMAGVVFSFALSAGLASFFALVFWASGLTWIIKALKDISLSRKNKTAYASYVFICIPPIYFIVGSLI